MSLTAARLQTNIGWNRQRQMSFLPLVKLWLWLSALATLAGWTLSAFGQLNIVGYLIFFTAFAIFIFVLRRELRPRIKSSRTSSTFNKWLRRFRRPLPACFALMTVLIFIGGVLYAPTNYTGISYRLPRALQWLAHDQWVWIHTPVFRMNDRACGIEWLSAPFLLFTKSTRGLFLINFIPYLLLPGLIFSVFTRLGIRARVAWQWMWLFPSAYNFILQAGSAANDTFPTIYALAALDFGCRAWKSHRVSDVWHSIIAAALLVGAKASNLPLLLPWAILLFALLPLLRKRIIATVLVSVLALTISFLPTALLNAHYLRGDWSGLSIEREGMNMKQPVVGVWGNAFLISFENFIPPLFPAAGWWNQHALDVLPTVVTKPMVANFEQGFHLIGELPTEDWAGIGFGLSCLIVISVVAARLARRRMAGFSPGTMAQPIPKEFQRLVLFSPWIALLAFCVKSGMVTPQRLIAPYYPLLLPSFLLSVGCSVIVRHKLWRAATIAIFALAFLVLIVSPDRPLWPAKTVLVKAVEKHPGSRVLNRALNVYTVYSRRGDPLANVRDLIPTDAKVIGFIGTEDDADLSLWLPLGSRRVEHFLLTDPPAMIRSKVNYVALGGLNLQNHGTTIDQWLQQNNAELVGASSATLKVSEGEQSWYIVRLR
jgi:hypothetical protein